MYRVAASASEYLMITGFGIHDVRLSKEAWILPGQSCTLIDVSPASYTFQVQAMSAEKLPIILSTVFTVGPLVDEELISLQRYAKLVFSPDHHDIRELVQGTIEGATRVLAASMSMAEIDIDDHNEKFKQEVSEKAQPRLNQFGLLIYNAKIDVAKAEAETKADEAAVTKIKVESSDDHIEVVAEAANGGQGKKKGGLSEEQVDKLARFVEVGLPLVFMCFMFLFLSTCIHLLLKVVGWSKCTPWPF
ncbi:Flotillin family [Parasponia andersonii]|uniref:Flotillin-like n=1 Tax=Parasponia andersonii TaxID=3476 RepID=A0A2P5DDE1_PARAD|nr:Flotillin family [Parasponia andersonii]